MAFRNILLKVLHDTLNMQPLFRLHHSEIGMLEGNLDTVTCTIKLEDTHIEYRRDITYYLHTITFLVSHGNYNASCRLIYLQSVG